MIDPGSLNFVFLALATASGKDFDQASIARRIKEGDHRAFKSFFDAHYDQLFRFLRSKQTHPEVVRDLIQQAFIYIWEHRNQIDPERSLRSYLFRIVYTRMLNHQRDRKKFDESTSIPERESSHTPEDTVRANDLSRAINKSIEQMPEKRGMVFRLCFLEDLTYKEAARALDVSPKTIENHMALALKDIRKALQAFK